MVMEILKIVGTALTILLLAACQKEADIKLPESKEEIVVTSFLDPDDTLISVVVRSSKPKYGSGSTPGSYPEDQITNARVTIGDGVTTVTLSFDSLFFFYRTSQTNLKIESGKTYYLDVLTPDGKNVSARTQVPTGKMQFDTVIAVKKSAPQAGWVEYDLSVGVLDMPGQVTFVSVYSLVYADSSFFSVGNPMPNTHFDNDERTEKSKYYFSTSGGTYSGPGDLYVKAVALNCSKEFYLYNESVQRSLQVGGNPFADPVLIYTNIDGGLGCFGSFVANTKRKKID